MKDKNGLFERIDTPLEGFFEIKPVVRSDVRVSFIKTFHEPAFKELGLETDFIEEFHTISVKNVIRAMHFQLPPEDHVKLVYCAEGCVMDVVADLRKSSPTYGKFHIVNLDSKIGNMLYIPKGFAHGYQVLTERSVVIYKTTTVFSAKHDTGLMWNSFGIPWTCDDPILSDKDKVLPKFADFDSPF